MKKLLKPLRTAMCILLACLLLCGVMGAGLTAAAAPDLSLLTKPLTDFLATYDLANLTEAQTQILIDILNTLKALGIDYKPFLDAVEVYLSAAVKAMLEAVGLMDYSGGQAQAAGLSTLTNFLAGYDLENLTEGQLSTLIGILTALKKAGINYKPLLDAVSGYLPMVVKAALHDAGLMSYPIWERDFLMYLIFKYLLFGWIWMEGGQMPGFLAGLFA